MPKENSAVENALATIGAVLWTIQILPQIWKSYKSKSTLGLSATLMLIWALASPFFASYIVVEHLSIPLQIQPHIFGFLCTFSWCQCLYYGKGYSNAKTAGCFILFLGFWAGFEVGSIYALWAGQRNGTDAPVQLYGYLSAVLLAVALLPQYWEIYKLKEVLGISLIFMAIDIGGGLFSLLSLFFRPSIDVAALVSYLGVVVLDGIVVILAFILNPIAKRRRLREAERTGPSSTQCRDADLEERGVTPRVVGDKARVSGNHDVQSHPPPNESVRLAGEPADRSQSGLPTPFGVELGRGTGMTR